jgi:hypothetical protein
MAKQNALELLQQLSLEDIDAKIASLQEELDGHTKRLGGEIDGLKVIRKAVDLRVNGKKPRQERKPRAAKAPVKQPAYSISAGSGDSPGPAKIRIIRYLNGRNGGAKPATIASDLGLGYQNVYDIVRSNDEIFYKDQHGAYFLREGAA